MSQYAALDERIISAIRRGDPPLYCGGAEVDRLADATGQNRFSIMNNRIQALRKSGRIEFGRWKYGAARRWRLAPSPAEATEEKR